jgi:hypothetical protein
MAKLWDEGFKELPTNRKGIALFSPVDKVVTDLGLLRYPRFRDSVQTQGCGRKRPCNKNNETMVYWLCDVRCKRRTFSRSPLVQSDNDYI